MEKETLEEAADKFADDCTLISDVGAYIGFIEGAKWAQERMYSEEEVIDLLQKMNDWPTICEGKSDIEEWFKQFKK